MDHKLEQIEQVEKVGIDAFIYAVYAALIPLNMILNFTGNTINRYVGIIAAAFIGMAVLVKRKKGINLPKPVSTLIAFTVWCLLTSFWSISQRLTSAQLVTFISSVALCLIGIVRDFNAKELRLIKFFMSMSSAILVFYLAPNKDISWSRGTLSNSTGHADQNSLAANLLFAFWMTIDLYRTTDKRSGKILYGAAAVLIVIGLLFIASRGAIIAFIISLIVYAVAFKKEKIRFSTIVIVAVAATAIYFIVAALEFTSIERLSIASIMEDAGTGRFYIWGRLFSHLAQDGVLRVFSGYGFGTEYYITRMATGAFVGVHNTYVEYLFTTGFIGLWLLIAFLIAVFKNSKKNKDDISIVLLISLVVICIPLGFFLNKGTWNILMLAIIGNKVCAKPEETDGE